MPFDIQVCGDFLTDYIVKFSAIDAAIVQLQYYPSQVLSCHQRAVTQRFGGLLLTMEYFLARSWATVCEFGAINGEQLIAAVPVIVGFCKLAFLTAEQFAAVGQSIRKFQVSGGLIWKSVLWNYAHLTYRVWSNSTFQNAVWEEKGWFDCNTHLFLLYICAHTHT